jgi:hypothetical protein
MSRTNKYSRTLGDFLFVGAIGILLLLLRHIARRPPVLSSSEPGTTQVSDASASLQQRADSKQPATDEIALDSNNKVTFNIVDTVSPSGEVPSLQEVPVSDPIVPVTQEDVAELETEENQELDDSVEKTKAYCVKCREKREMQDEQKIVTKNGRNALEGTCPVCGTKLFRFVAR